MFSYLRVSQESSRCGGTPAALKGGFKGKDGKDFLVGCSQHRSLTPLISAPISPIPELSTLLSHAFSLASSWYSTSYEPGGGVPGWQTGFAASKLPSADAEQKHLSKYMGNLEGRG